MTPDGVVKISFSFCFLVSCLCPSFRVARFLFNGLKILQDEFRFYDFNVTLGIDSSIYVNNIRVVETTDDMGNRVDVADVGEKLISKPFSFAGTLHKAGNVNELDGRWDDFWRSIDLCQTVNPGIGNRHNTDVRVDSTKRDRKS